MFVIIIIIITKAGASNMSEQVKFSYQQNPMKLETPCKLKQVKKEILRKCSRREKYERANEKVRVIADLKPATLSPANQGS